MRLSHLPGILSLGKYLRLRQDFKTPVAALVAASGMSRRRFRLVTRDDHVMTVDRGDTPVWKEYFESRRCAVRIERGLFRIIPHDVRAPSYLIQGGNGGATYQPAHWQPLPEDSLAAQLARAERRVFSQHGEDGVIEALQGLIGTTNRFVVEFGAHDGICMSNSRNLIVNHGWSALLIEADERFYRRLAEIYSGCSNVHTLKSLVLEENINALFQSAGVPRDFGVLSIDIDSIDFYVWRALTKFEPDIVVIEYNSSIAPGVHYTVSRELAVPLAGTNKEGASLQSVYELGKSKGYLLVYAELSGANLFFVHQRHAAKLPGRLLPPNALYQPPQFGVLAGGAAPNGRGYADPPASIPA